MGKLWYEKPAIEWEEALPIGNGRLGAMVYGGADKELIQVNEESMWFGGPVNRHNPDARENLPKIRKYLENGEIHKAEMLMDAALSGCPDSMHSYQTLGEIQVCFDGLGNASNRKNWSCKNLCLPQGTVGYRRQLELERAVCTTDFCCDGVSYHREYFASHPADAIIMRFSAEGEGTVNLTARLRRGKWFDGVKKTGENGILLYGNLGKGGYEFAMELRARTVGGKVSTIGECLKIEGAKQAILYFTADTTWYYSADEREAWCEGYSADTQGQEDSWLTEELSPYERQEADRQQALQALLAEKLAARFERLLAADYESLLEEHIRDYTALYDRVRLRLKEDEVCGQLPTDVRLQAVKDGKTDIGLGKMLFDYGRYLIIASSREGGLPATLQGLWNKDFFPSWDSKYTININTEMNYWHVESCNLPECHMPLFELLRKVQKNGRHTARVMYGCRGFVAHHNTDIHGDTAPQDIWYPGSYWTLGAAWLCTHLWKHYCYTQDIAFLQKAFPMMAEAALFFVDFLTEKDGYFVTNPSVSPENSYILPNGEHGSCCIGATMDNQILRELFDGCLKAWELLGKGTPEGCKIPDVDDVPELMGQIRERREHLMPDRISASGRIMEWMEDYEEVEPGHRHISHLYGLYPAGQITVDGTPELAAAARKTLEYRLANGGGHTGWSRAWIMNHYASLWDGEKAYENICKMLELSTYPNLFDRHPPFQIDGNFGACAAISRMLVQSNEERVVLLPALPQAWHTGEAEGLRLFGNAAVSMRWENGKLLSARIKADSAYSTVVVCQGESRLVTLKQGEEQEIF